MMITAICTCGRVRLALIPVDAYAVLRPSKLFALGLLIAFLVFGYFCILNPSPKSRQKSGGF